jgi:hypothetical protein
VSNTTLLLQKFEDQRKLIMKIKGLFMKVMLFNEIVKNNMFKPNIDIGRFCD